LPCQRLTRRTTSRTRLNRFSMKLVEESTFSSPSSKCRAVTVKVSSTLSRSETGIRSGSASVRLRFLCAWQRWIKARACPPQERLSLSRAKEWRDDAAPGQIRATGANSLRPSRSSISTRLRQRVPNLYPTSYLSERSFELCSGILKPGVPTRGFSPWSKVARRPAQ
jgi:hypothetical protein